MQFQNAFWGPNGFEELRKFIKQGGDFCKDIATVLHERSELEATYAKGLLKLSSKIAKASKESFGTTQYAWQEVAAEMETEAEIHKTLSVELSDDIVKPLKVMVDNLHKSRKSLESAVDKAAKSLSDRRNEEYKSKKTSYSCARENERMQEQALDAKASRGRVLTEKDLTKLETKRRKAEESLTKADFEYYGSCIKAERARQEWETVVYKASSDFQQMEEDRLNYLQDVNQKYVNHLSMLGPRMVQAHERLSKAISTVDVTSDLQTAVQIKGTGQNIPEQHLPDFYAEDLNNNMNKDRRKVSVERFLQLLKHDVEVERKGKQGVENLSRVFQETPTFGDADAQQEVNEKLQHMRAMLTFLEATRHKLQCALADIDGCVRPTHPLSNHMEQFKDKQGISQTVLKVPHWVRMERRFSESSGSGGSDSVECDGLHIAQDHDDNESLYANLPAYSPQLHEQCRALYNYEAKLGDELSLVPGDVIKIYKKTEDGWWEGELRGKVGVFPNTYVEVL